ncbi:hypothetical protein A6R68_19800, partial [Neotoma lepida]
TGSHHEDEQDGTGAILRQKGNGIWSAGIAESGDRLLWHLPERPGSAGTTGPASARSPDRGRATSAFTMILQRISRLSSVLRSAVSVHLRRNIGVTAVAFNKELDPVQKLFLDKIREYKSKRQASGGPVDTGPEYQQDLDRELFKLKQMFGKGDMNTFPTFKFEGHLRYPTELRAS